jgi:competence protein ComEC
MVLTASLAMGVAGWRAAQQSSDRLNPVLESVDLVLEGVVARLPQLQVEGVRFWFEVESARRAQAEGSLDRLLERPAEVVPPLVVLGWSVAADAGTGSALPPVRAGDRWQLPVRLKAPHGALNPEGIDHEAWLWSQGVMAVGQVRPTAPQPAQAQLLATRVGHPIERWRQACRDRLWQQGLEPRLAGIIAALLLGDQAALDPLDWDVFRRTGVAHLMSISGLHITMLAAALSALITAWWRRGEWRRRPLSLVCPAMVAGRWGGLLLAAGYAVFSGWGLPAQRTVLMLAVSVLLRSRGLRWPWWITWLTACAVVLAWDPWAWLQAGFWLSFVAVGLLMAWEDRHPSAIDGAAASAPRGGRWVGMALPLARAAWRLWREQWRITLGLAPLTLLLFREVSCIGVLANLLAIPWVTLCVTPLALLGVIAPEAWQLAAWALEGLRQVLTGLLAWGLPTWSVAAFPVWVAVAGIVGAGLCCLPAPAWLRCWGLPLLVPALGWQATPPPPGEVAVVAADVGQGQAVLVRTAHHVLLYDAGPRYSQDMDAGQRVVVPLLQSLNARLDRLVLSHRDADHTGGAPSVLAMHPGADVLGSLPARSALAQRRGYRDCEAGQSWNWDGVQFEVLHPSPEGPSRATSNAWSCVLRVRTRGSSLLLTGDIEAHEEADLVQRLGPRLKTDIMLVPHHGSRTSSTAGWLDAVQPQVAWVQAGYRNRYGHPAVDVLARYQERHIWVLETARCGAIQWFSVQPGQMICERDKRRRYWHHMPG